jgi:radical SAM protein with 4Fe4S-binding SPASM domain
MDAPRENMNETATVKFSDVESILAERFGDRFRLYRVDYNKSLNYDKNGFLPDFPITVALELVNRCNLSCVMCYTINHSAPKATLGLPEIRALMEECGRHGLPALVVGMGAEPLVYKNVRSVFDLARGAGVMDVFLGTNGMLLNEDLCEYLVTNEVARIEISLDAATPKTYEKIRGKDELERIERNIHTLLEVKKRHRSKLPIIRLCFCLQPLNAHEREAFLDKWRGLVDYADIQQLQDFGYVDELRERGDVSEEAKLLNGSAPEPYCSYPFNSLNVWSNGDVTPCCTFYAKNLVAGNIGDSSLAEIWHGAYMRDLRQQFLSDTLNPTCLTCLAQRDTELFEEVKPAAARAAAD